MNDPLDLVDRLAARARQHSAEPLYVADDVVRQLRKPERGPLVWVTVCAVVATVLVFALVGVPRTEADPLGTFFQAANFIRTEGGL